MNDSSIYGHLWGTEELRALFTDQSRIEAWLDILRALARAQAELGIIPEAAAREITAQAMVANLDLGFVASETRATSHSLLGLIRAVQRVVSSQAGEWFCYGATVQDVSDTWSAIVIRQVGAVMFRDLRGIEATLLNLAQTHRATPVVARTHGQQGLPIPFGFKVAVWAAEIRRHLERLEEGKTRWLVGQLGGAAGTGSFWGERAAALQKLFCSRLGLGVPDGAWLTSRDRPAEFASLLAMVAMTLAKVGNEIVQLQRPEIGEAAEPFLAGEVGSITMPHKRNPERSEHLVTLARLARADASVLLEAMIVEHERDGRSWKAEWAAFPHLCLLVGTSLAIARTITTGLIVDPQAMLRNLNVHQGYVFSERAMLMLAAKLGKQTAHRAVYEAAMSGQEQGLTFRQALEASGEVMTHLEKEELNLIFDTKAVLGTTPSQVDSLVVDIQERRQLQPDSWP